MKPSLPPIIRETEWVDETELRRIFNDGNIPGIAARVSVTRSKPVPEEKNIRGWIPGTMSQEVKYYDHDDNLLAKVHRYLRPDGELAASGKEDPKRVLWAGIMYILEGPKDATIEP